MKSIAAGGTVYRFRVQTRVREELVDVTAEVTRAIRASGVIDGAAVVFSPHTTAGVTINENADPDVTADLLDALRRLVPRDAGFRHVEGNSDAHVKASLIGSSVTVPVEEGRPALGTWQAIYFAEFDGPRSRQCVVSVLAGSVG